MKKILFIFYFVLTLFLSVCVYAQNDSNVLSLDVEGSADISRKGVAGARKDAIHNALENAILEATANLMSIPVDDDRLQPVKSIIIDEPDKYVNNYKIVAEMKKPDSYKVNVNVVVNLVRLKIDLNKMGFLRSVQAGNISLVVLLDVKGLKKYSDFLSLSEFLQSRKEIVKNIYTRRFEWQQAHFEIEIIADGQYLVDELTKTGRYALNSGITSDNKIEMICLEK